MLLPYVGLFFQFVYFGKCVFGMPILWLVGDVCALYRYFVLDLVAPLVRMRTLPSNSHQRGNPFEKGLSSLDSLSYLGANEDFALKLPPKRKPF